VTVDAEEEGGDDAGNEPPMRRGVATAMRSSESAHTWHQGADDEDDDDADDDDADDEGAAVNSKSTM
jgi:hypothetical protein